MTWQPMPRQLLTRWAGSVKPDHVWPEYPRPQMVRPEWFNLNGLWDYGITNLDADAAVLQGQILVPFAPESALSGVKRPLLPDERLWYRRTFRVPDEWRGRHVLLHFGAVDWEAEVRVNQQSFGTHRGGFLPFWFDVTQALVEGENELVVSVWDPTDAYWQQRGKQVLHPRTIWYTAVSGIWQTVWLEPVPDRFIAGLKITPDLDAGSVRVDVRSGCPAGDLGMIQVQVRDGGVPVAEARSEEELVELAIPSPKLWSPASPHLYELIVETEEDRVESYFGMRKFGLGRDAQGRVRLCLNDQPLFQYGPLDQGYWPDGLYTPPSEAAMYGDLEAIRNLGCNMLRKHVKVEPARYYYHCDRMGLIVWQDMINGGKAVGDATSFLAILFGSRRRDGRYRYAGREVPEARQDYLRELKELVDHLHNFACIGMWVPFNEGWGQFDANRAARWLKSYDPTRPVDQASGWFDQGGGDCKSLHVYFKPLPRSKPAGHRALVLSEFGGYSLRLDGHAWDPQAEFGYRKLPTSEALTDAYLKLLEEELTPWIERGLSAAIYTQTTDVEIEVNGFLSYDRVVEKMDFGRVRVAHRKLLGVT